MLSDERRNQLARRLAEIAGEAGTELNRYRAAGCASVLKPDGSPVSEADIASERIVLARLGTEFPAWPVISEESSESQESNPADCFFLVDPLDGTKAFLANGPDFCVLIALIAEGAPIAAAIHAPATGESWWAGAAAWVAKDIGFDAVHRLAPRPPRVGAPIAIVSSQHAGESSRGLCEKLKITEIRRENSALKFARLAEAEADIYPRIGRTMQWDIAAGDGLLRALGGGVFDLEGHALRYGAGASGWASPDFIAYRRAPDATDTPGE